MPLIWRYWTDPGFRSEQRAFYYVRVLEIPTPRWTTYDAKLYGVEKPEEVLRPRSRNAPTPRPSGTRPQRASQHGVTEVETHKASRSSCHYPQSAAYCDIHSCSAEMPTMEAVSHVCLPAARSRSSGPSPRRTLACRGSLSRPSGQARTRPMRRSLPDRGLLGRHPSAHGAVGGCRGLWNALGPEDAYRFARGEEVVLVNGQPVKLRGRSTGLVITDHSDGMGFDHRRHRRAPQHRCRPRGQALVRGLAGGW